MPSLARITQKHPDYKGPQMGPKMATENKRNFTGEQYVLFKVNLKGLRNQSKFQNPVYVYWCVDISAQIYDDGS